MNEIELIDKYFRASNYIAACQLYLMDNPLLKRPLQKDDLKKKLVGHWGTVPGQNFIYTHLNRIINKYDLNMIYICGPGHGGNFFVAQSYMEETYSELYPEITYDESGLKKLFKQFSFPGGIGSHATPEVPGSISEGGELGYSLSHAYGAVLDNPNLICACVVGDGEAETGPLATSWHGNKFINPKKDGIVLPILHLNGYKISNPTVLSRMSDKSLAYYFSSLNYYPIFVKGNTDYEMHQEMIKALDKAVEMIKKIKSEDNKMLPFYPMIILRSKKGWSGPKVVDEKAIENNFRAHQIPINVTNDTDLKLVEKWLKSYHPEELFDETGTLIKEIREYHPKGIRRMSANPLANGGLLRRDLILPSIDDYQVKLLNHGSEKRQDMEELSKYIRDIFKLNKDNFRLFGPDECMSNRLFHIFENENRSWQLPIKNTDEHLSKDGRIIDSFLSEHLCEGMLEGYLLTGRHGTFVSYEAFIRVVDSMISQHTKWIKMAKEINWRESISSLNLILTSNVWQQDHNGYTHQDPGFIDHLANKKGSIIRAYLPIDTNTLLSTYEHCIKSKDYVNVIVASKHPSNQWLSMEEAKIHCQKGLSVFNWASNNPDKADIVIATCGDTPNIEGLAACQILKKELPELNFKYINVIDIMKLAKEGLHPHSLTDEEYDELFTKDKPIIFLYHGYPSFIRELTYGRNNHNLTIYGYEEEGSITTAFDMRVRNNIDRYHLVLSVLEKMPKLDLDNKLCQKMLEKLEEHHKYIIENGIDMDEIVNFKWEN